MASQRYADAVMSLGPRWYFPMDDAAGTVCRELVRANHGVYTSGPSTRRALVRMPDDGASVLYASASSQHMAATTSTMFDFGTGDFSLLISFMRPTATGGTSEFLIGRDVASAGGNGYELFMVDSGTGLDSRIGAVTITGAATVAGDVHHGLVSMTRAGNGQIYVDGVASGAAVAISSESAFSATVSAPLYAGRRPSGSYWDGYLAHFAGFARALSANDARFLNAVARGV